MNVRTIVRTDNGHIRLTADWEYCQSASIREYVAYIACLNSAPPSTLFDLADFLALMRFVPEGCHYSTNVVNT